MTGRLFITIQDQIACVERELRYRIHVYERRVAQGKLTREKADYELAVMQEVLNTLKGKQP